MGSPEWDEGANVHGRVGAPPRGPDRGAQRSALPAPEPSLAETIGPSAPRGRPVPERYRLSEAAALLGVSVAALRRRAQAGQIALERDPQDSLSVSQEELARHVATHTPRPGGRPPAVPEEVLERIAGLRAEGLSYARIAALLTLDGVPTGHGGRRWWASSVRAVLARRGRPPGA